ncbi:hypothetical protein JOE33_002954 [Pseudomonas sp. PvP027]|uniref:hypothetical protein n=1 Tax=Pseudomonas TaxID=286 RepID=UPI000BB64038|nr:MULTISPECIES: hypothetical protein [Pseudomonas]MBC8801294.1 hypothetical protein [Pseudomonas congelans]MBP1146031.1 hypothetical protein [Pseudomonas sp. PvP027]PBP95472.1 hypothetical protein CCL17_23685 [Pseudomonas congelans]
MNIDKIEFSAKVLEGKLKEYALKDDEASRLYDDLRPLLELAKSRRIISPIQWGKIPGRYRFTENGLQEYRELEEAYAVFSIEITGGEPPLLKILRAERNQNSN